MESQSSHSASLIGPITTTVYSFTLRETDPFFFITQVHVRALGGAERAG